jgi:hypothetical protein
MCTLKNEFCLSCGSIFYAVAPCLLVLSSATNASKLCPHPYPHTNSWLAHSKENSRWCYYYYLANQLYFPMEGSKKIKHTSKTSSLYLYVHLADNMWLVGARGRALILFIFCDIRRFRVFFSLFTKYGFTSRRWCDNHRVMMWPACRYKPFKTILQ